MEIEAAAMMMKSGSCYSIDDGGAAEVLMMRAGMLLQYR